MSILKNIADFFKSIGAILEHKASQVVLDIATFASHVWTILEPYLQAVLSQTAQDAWESLQTLAVEACQYVEQQGFPTQKDAQDAFLAYMTSKAKDQVAVLKTSELNLLRETALQIMKSWTATTPTPTA